MTFDQRWETTHSERQWGIYPSEHLVRFSRSVEWPQNPKAMDLGCGAGAQSLFLADEGFMVDAFDASSSACERLDSLDNGQIAIVCRDIFEIPEIDESCYDLIVDVCTLQHLGLGETKQIIQRALTWLKPGGFFFSVMAGLGHDRGGIPPRVIGPYTVRELFVGYSVPQIGRAELTWAGRTLSHWIIAAGRP